MKFKTLMIIKAIVCIVTGPILLFFPGKLFALVGGTFVPAAAITTREYGSALLGNFMLAWFGRNAEASTTRRAIILDLFVYDAVAFFALLPIQFAKGMNQFGWGIVATYLFFALTFGYFLLPQKQSA